VKFKTNVTYLSVNVTFALSVE